MKLLLDMNVSPLWIAALTSSGFEVHHWSNIGRADAPDGEILHYATTHHLTIFTQDLDFGIALARTGAEVPSVVQLHSNDVLPESIGERRHPRTTSSSAEVFGWCPHHNRSEAYACESAAYPFLSSRVSTVS